MHAPARTRSSVMYRDGLRHYESLAQVDGVHPVETVVEQLPAVYRARQKVRRAQRALDEIPVPQRDLLIEYQDAVLAYCYETARHYYAAGYAFGSALPVRTPSRQVVRRLIDTALCAELPPDAAVRSLLAAAAALLR